MTDQAAAPAHRPVWAVTATAGGFGLFYAYAVWSAVAFLIQCAAQSITGYGWFVLLLPIAFPIVVFGGAFAAGRRRGLLVFAFLLLAGLALVAVFWLNVVGMVAGAPASIFMQS
ncbi:MAG: bacitracin resistance protein [Microbacterium sp.]|uniref:bacitracin resistance protein n=1 Tax=Microbacterium sp. TaxID=51671 RepID=UPI0039E631B6